MLDFVFAFIHISQIPGITEAQFSLSSELGTLEVIVLALSSV